ncbi:MAG: CYTH domain-containing protein [Gammaproteobacteria bacterium]|nr:CYTH domain-containing protein [Gammaproteobacteria bacterium]
MPLEIERKFLLKNNNWRQQVKTSKNIRQGYLAPLDTSSVRIRIEDGKANINIKSATIGISRLEYEYQIPHDEALEMLDQLCRQPQIHKTRHTIAQGHHLWEIDEFYDDNEGLLVAEIELGEEGEDFEKPEWLGKEVSDDARYYNVNLINHPYMNWS